MQKFFLGLCLSLISLSSIGQATNAITDADKKYKEVKELVSQQDYAFAYTLVKDLKKQYPESTQSDHAYINDDLNYFEILCAVKLNQAQAKEAAEVYITSVNNNPRRQMMSFHLAHAYFLENNFSAAIKYFDIAGYDNLSNEQIADAKFEKAYAYFNEKQFAAAKPLFNEIHQLPNNKYYIPANYYYGFISYYDKDYEQALQSFQLVEMKDEYKAIVPYYIAEIYYFQGKKDLVLSYGESVLKRNTSLYYEKQLKLLMGQIYFENKNYAKALSLLEDYVTGSEKVTKEILYELSYSYYKENQYTKAIDGFKQLSNEKDSMGQNSMYILGDLYLKTNQKENARNAFQYSAYNSSNPKQQRISRFTYAKLNYELGYQNIAMKEMRSFLEDYPTSEYDSEAKEIMVNLLTKTNNFKEALAMVKNLQPMPASLQKVYPKILYGRAIEEINDQHLAEADALLSNIISNPNAGAVLPYAHFWKGEIAYRQMRYEEAIRNLNVFAESGASAQGEANRTAANYDLAYSWLQKENFAQAKTYFDKVSQSVNASASAMEQDAYLRAADSRFMLKEYAAATNMYNQIIQYQLPQADYAAYQKAMITGIKSSADKIAALNNLQKAYPQSNLLQEVNMEIAQAYIADEKFAAAIPYLNKVLVSGQADGLKPKAYLKLGLAYYNDNNNKEALVNYETLINKYPQSAEADEAIDIVKNIYVEEGKPNAYVELMQKNGISISVNEADSLTYISAELKYKEDNCTAALNGFANYLSKYPQGKFVIDAQYNSAVCLQKNKDFKGALDNYAAVSNRGLSKYFENASLEAARINYFELQDYTQAKKYFSLLRANAVNQNNLLEALRGLVRSQYLLKDYKEANAAAQDLLNQKGLSTDDKSIANLVIGKAQQQAGNCNEAIIAFKNVAAINKSAWGAEARYELAYCQFSMGSYTTAESSAMKVIKETGSYDLWMTKAYILLGDIFMKQKDYFNAKATFESVAKNAAIDNLKIEAQQKLAAAIAEEKSQSKVAN